MKSSTVAACLGLLLCVASVASAEEALSTSGRSLQSSWANMGFPWCKCGNRDPKGTPISIKYTGVQTAGKHRYACFALSVDSSYDPSCAECSKMAVGKIEFHLTVDAYNMGCLVGGQAIAGSWGEAPYGHSVAKCTNLWIDQKDIVAAGNAYPICFGLGKYTSLSQVSGFDNDSIELAIFEPSTDPKCCPVFVIRPPPPPPPHCPSPPPPKCPANPPPKCPSPPPPKCPDPKSPPPKCPSPPPPKCPSPPPPKCPDPKSPPPKCPSPPPPKCSPPPPVCKPSPKPVPSPVCKPSPVPSPVCKPDPSPSPSPCKSPSPSPSPCKSPSPSPSPVCKPSPKPVPKCDPSPPPVCVSSPPPSCPSPPPPKCPSPPPPPVVDPGFPFCVCNKKADFGWRVAHVSTDPAKTGSLVTLTITSGAKCTEALLKLELLVDMKGCRGTIGKAMLNDHPVTGIWENDRPVLKFTNLNLVPGKTYTLTFVLTKCTLSQLCKGPYCQYAVFNNRSNTGKCPVNTFLIRLPPPPPVCVPSPVCKPSPVPSPVCKPSPSPSPSPCKSPSPSPSPCASPKPSPSPCASPKPSPSPCASPAPSPKPCNTPTPRH